MAGHHFAFGSFVLDLDNGTLFRDGELLAVSQRGARLLGALVKDPGAVVAKAALMDAAWPGIAVEESNLSVQIASLRKLLGPAPRGSEWIVTVPRVGYRFLGAAGGSTASAPSANRQEPIIPSLAVLPFINLTGDVEQDYFADGVVEDIITALSRFRSFAVIARNSSFVYKGRAVDVREVAADLGIRYVLEGSVRRAGNRLRISAQLVDGDFGTHLWAENFDGAVDAVFDFQDRITESVAMVVEPHIQLAEIERGRRERPRSIAAYDLYLQALPHVFAESAERNRNALELFTRAVAIEPDNALYLAWAGYCYEHRGAMAWPPIGADDTQACIALAHRALDRAGGDAVVLALCAGQLIHQAKEYDLGMAAIRAAVDANPYSMIVVSFAGVQHLHCGDVADSLDLFHRAIRLSPRDPSAHFPLTGIAHAQMVIGDYPEALTWARRSLGLNPNFAATYWMLVAANAHLGRMDEAKRWLDQLRAIVPGTNIAGIWAGQPQKDPSRLAAILDGLRMAGLEEGTPRATV